MNTSAKRVSSFALATADRSCGGGSFDVLDAEGAREHVAIRALANVKLRLGRLVERGGRFEQKGVDSLILRDLMTLAHARAIATAWIVAGDEELREGIAAAQDVGVRVAVIGAGEEEGNQAESLLAEADETLYLKGRPC